MADGGDLLIEMGVTLGKLNRQLARAESDMRRAAQKQEQAFKKANDKIARDFERLQKQANQSLSKIRVPGLALGSFGAGLAGVLSTREIMRYADAWTSAGNMIAAAGQVAGRSGRSLSELNDIADETRSGFSETVNLYARMLRATADVAKSEEEVARATEIVNKAFKAGGAAAQEQAAGVLQLGQALGSGMLQGDELRSIRENAPLIAQAIADEFGTTIGKLKDLGAEGELTSARVFQAILKAQPKIEAAFSVTNATIADGFTRLKNAMTEYVATTDGSVGASMKLGNALNFLAENLNLVAAGIGVLAARAIGPLLAGIAAVLTRAGAGMVGLATGATSATVAIGGLRAALGLLGGPAGAVLAALAVLPLVTTSAAQKTAEMRDVSDGAATALDAFAGASERAKAEQENLQGAVTGATQAMLAQSRVALQESRRTLERQLKDQQGIVDGGNFTGALRALEGPAAFSGVERKINPVVDAIRDMLEAIRDGKGDVRATALEMQRLAGIGDEVADAFAVVDSAFDDFGAEGLSQAYREVVRLAVEIGGFDQELDALARAKGDADASAAAFTRLRTAMENAADAGRVMRQDVFTKLREDLGVLTETEALLQAVQEALRGNWEEARRLAAMANPFRTATEGAAELKAEVLSLTEAMANIPKEIATTFKGLESVSSGVEAATKLLEKFEGFRSVPYDDGKRDGSGNRVGPPVWRAGWGSDTVTLADGTIQKITQGMRVSVEDADRDLRRRLETEFLPAARAGVGGGNFDALTPAQQGVLGSLSYNYGAGAWSGPLKAVAEAVRAGSVEGVAEAIAALGSHNGGINRDRRLGEASVFANGIGMAGSLARGQDAEKAVAEAAKEAEKAAKEQADALEKQLGLRTEIMEMGQRQVADAQFELSIMGLTAVEQEQARLRYELINAAKERGVALTERLAGSEKTVGQAIEEQVAAIGEVTALNERRSQVLEDNASRQAYFNSLQDQMKNGLLDAIVAGESFSDVIADIARQLAKAALQAALFNEGPFASAGGGTGLLGAIFGGFRASGGPIDPGKFYVAGERGPEIIVPRVPGQVIPNHALGSGGGGRAEIIVRSEPGTIVEIARREAVDVTTAGIAQYNQALPGRVQQIKRDPRAR